MDPSTPHILSHSLFYSQNTELCFNYAYVHASFINPFFRFISEHMLTQEQPNSTVPKSKENQNRIIKHSASCMFFSWLCIKLEWASGCVLERAVHVWHGLVCVCPLVHRLNGVYWCVLLLCCCEEIFKNSLESRRAAFLHSLPVGFGLAPMHITHIHTHTHYSELIFLNRASFWNTYGYDRTCSW